MSEKKLISIIIPVHNAEKYILRCLSSIKAQTYENFEVILVDDGSVDDTIVYCTDIIHFDKRFKYIRNISNRGVSAVRNQGLKNAVGEWVWFIDADDWIEPTALECLAKEIEQSIDFISFDFVKERGAKKKIISNPFEDKQVIDRKLFYRNIFCEYCHFSLAWSHIFRREFLVKRNLMFDETLALAEDCEFMVRVGNEITQAKILRQGLYHYIVNMDSASQKWKPGFQEKYVQSVKKISNDLSGNRDIDEIKPFFYGWVVNVLKIILLKDIFHPDHKISWSERKNSAERLLSWSVAGEAFNGAYIEKPIQRGVYNCIRYRAWHLIAMTSYVYYRFFR